MTDAARRHWEEVYEAKESSEVSWYQALPARSLDWIAEVAPPAADPRLIDVGAGASTLVDHLLDRGYRRITVLDLAGAALAVARERLGPREAEVEWVVSDLLDHSPAEPFDVWHDRAVLHFLVDEGDRRRYADALRRSLRPGGHAVIATFAVGGPTRCSGLETVQYDAPAILSLLGDGFTLLREEEELHRTPAGAEQRFSWFLLRRESAGQRS